jgi:hypothetical protein
MTGGIFSCHCSGWGGLILAARGREEEAAAFPDLAWPSSQGTPHNQMSGCQVEEPCCHPTPMSPFYRKRRKAGVPMGW